MFSPDLRVDGRTGVSDRVVVVPVATVSYRMIRRQ